MSVEPDRGTPSLPTEPLATVGDAVADKAIPATAGTTTRRSREDIERDRDLTRQQLASTVDALAGRLDLKTRVTGKVSATTGHVRAAVREKPAVMAVAGGLVLVVLGAFVRRARR